MPPKLNWQEYGKHGALARDTDFEVRIVRLRGAKVGYPQCEWMWRMRFDRGCMLASAYLESLGGAKANADRIVAGMRGTHDWHGNEKRRA
jgi:hypothetical protein